MTPAFSIITPSYQQGRFIERTIQSVTSQSGPAFEHLVVDGGSTDETLSILRRYGDRLAWTSGPDKGQTDAINKGISRTKGDIIGWLNSDDIYLPGALLAVEQFFASHPEIDVVYGRAHHIGPGDEWIAEYPTEPWNFQRLCETCFICQPALLFRRRVVDRCGLLDASLHYAMDYEYWIRLAQAGVRFEYVDHYLAGSRLYPETKTLGSRVAVHSETNDMLRRRLGRVPDVWIINYAHAVADAKGTDRADYFRYARAVSWECLKAARRWQGGISSNIRRTVWHWLIDNAWGALTRSIAR